MSKPKQNRPALNVARSSAPVEGPEQVEEKTQVEETIQEAPAAMDAVEASAEPEDAPTEVAVASPPPSSEPAPDPDALPSRDQIADARRFREACLKQLAEVDAFLAKYDHASGIFYRVRSRRRKGFWRIGRKFTPVAELVAQDKLTEEQRKTLLDTSAKDLIIETVHI